MFSSLRVLSLGNVEMDNTEDLVRAFNWEMLQSLKLRRCRKWLDFLAEVRRSNQPLKLKQFELMSCVNDDFEDEIDVLQDFLRAFTGLGDLFIVIGDHSAALDIWELFLPHKPTLKRLYYNEEPIGYFSPNPSEISGASGSFPALCTQSDSPHVELDLEFFGVSALGCSEYYMVCIQPARLADGNSLTP